ncbi:ExbD/TolR family protein [Pseudothauera rhizosphaerae]|uniref:Biopolymer transporter ExbD n=1 Tax=Pseudothauera rhizosphaerae TaxID=2565932 RepID=A0A4V3WC14_9RHOO|nr:biopolymer transporter ExbD [Pseudothauera rhizosphaerae]THF65292.1 biopolymer transporter ExbD [Pseudothauera rhizosphaerae]
MAFGGLGPGSGTEPVREINMVPLIDVMLVLLIVFMITAPLLTHAVRIDLPQAAATADPERPETVTLALDAQDRLYWNGEELPAEVLDARLAQAAAAQPQPELHLRADRATRYERLAQVMAAARNAGVRKMGFVTVAGEGDDY